MSVLCVVYCGATHWRQYCFMIQSDVNSAPAQLSAARSKNTLTISHTFTGLYSSIYLCTRTAHTSLFSNASKGDTGIKCSYILSIFRYTYTLLMLCYLPVTLTWWMNMLFVFEIWFCLTFVVRIFSGCNVDCSMKETMYRPISLPDQPFNSWNPF